MKQVTKRLRPGQDLREKLEKLVQEKDIRAGVLLSVVGSLEKAVLRMAGATPQEQQVKTAEGPLEIVSGTGTLSPDGCHIHIAVSDAEGRVLGGHLKEGCIVATTAEVVIGVFEDVVYKRARDEDTGFDELGYAS